MGRSILSSWAIHRQAAGSYGLKAMVGWEPAQSGEWSAYAAPRAHPVSGSLEKHTIGLFSVVAPTLSSEIVPKLTFL